jgi:membrane protein DedA with SNARE-associated domain
MIRFYIHFVDIESWRSNSGYCCFVYSVCRVACLQDSFLPQLIAFLFLRITIADADWKCAFIEECMWCCLLYLVGSASGMWVGYLVWVKCSLLLYNNKRRLTLLWFKEKYLKSIRRLFLKNMGKTIIFAGVLLFSERLHLKSSGYCYHG